MQFHEPSACILLRDQGNWGLNGKLLFKCSIPSIWDLASEAGPQVSQYQFITRGLIYNISKLCIINCWLRGRHMERSGVNLKFYFRLCAKYFYFPIIHKSYLKDKYLCCCPLCIDTGGHHDTPLSAIKSVAMGGSRRSQEHWAAVLGQTLEISFKLFLQTWAGAGHRQCLGSHGNIDIAHGARENWQVCRGFTSKLSQYFDKYEEKMTLRWENTERRQHQPARNATASHHTCCKDYLVILVISKYLICKFVSLSLWHAL